MSVLNVKVLSGKQSKFYQVQEANTYKLKQILIFFKKYYSIDTQNSVIEQFFQGYVFVS